MPKNSAEFTKRQIELMQRACLLCDNSSLDVRTGCVIVKDGEVVGEGWNVTEEEHAEMMALKEAQEKAVALENATLFVSRFPCSQCAQKLVKAGISKLFYMSDHFSSGNEALPVFKAAGILVTQIPEKVVWNK